MMGDDVDDDGSLGSLVKMRRMAKLVVECSLRATYHRWVEREEDEIGIRRRVASGGIEWYERMRVVWAV
jgi:hypothetical protein